MITRDEVEYTARLKAGIIDTIGEYHWVNVLNGVEMYVLDSDKSVAPHLVREGFWESWITTWVINNVDKDTFFIDIGANTGYYAFLASSLGAITLAFEPNRVYADMIRATIERGRSAVVLSETALSNYWGEAILNIPTELHGSASLNQIIPGYETTTQKVSVRPLDEVLVEIVHEKAVIKIDAEGEEERILEGARKFLDETPEAVVLLEYTPGAYSINFVDELFEKWSVSWISHSGQEEPVSPAWIREQRDWVMLVLR